jgi:beta-galactosidase
LWDFSCAADTLETIPAVWEEVRIKVPSPYNINSFSSPFRKTVGGEEIYVRGGDFRLYPEYPLHWDSASCGFYRRTFMAGEGRVFLCFDAVAFRSVFYINGVKAAEECEAFLPIKIDVTKYLRSGEENELIVGTQAAGSMNYEDSDGRNRTDYPKGSFWGEHIAGIWQDVWLEETSDEYIEDVFPTTDIYRHTLHIQTETNARPGHELRYFLAKWPGGAEREISPRWQYTEGDGIELWEPENPALYNLFTRLYRGGELLDEVTTRFGFRTFTAEGNKFILNGRPINLKNDSWHYMGYSLCTDRSVRAGVLRYGTGRECKYYTAARPAFPGLLLRYCRRRGDAACLRIGSVGVSLHVQL